jgi:branched-chain amino acid transport system substrate-binding protein
VGFARYAVRLHARGWVRLAERDTTLDPAKARAAAAALRARPDVLAVVGPAGNQEVLAAAPVFNRLPRLAFVSASATHPALTNGSIPTFFRVVPTDDAQAPAVARHLSRRLKAKRVAIVDDGSSYSRALAARVAARLRAARVHVVRASVRQAATGFTAAVAAVPARTDAVFLPWQIAASAQLFGEQLRAAGRTAVVVGSDALDSDDFRLPGSFVAAFAPDVRAVPGTEAFVRGYGRPFVSRFGPPAYVATQAAIGAVRRACADGRADRAEVVRELRATSLPHTVLGAPLRFTRHGDRKGATFSIFEVGRDGTKRMVR